MERSYSAMSETGVADRAVGFGEDGWFWAMGRQAAKAIGRRRLGFVTGIGP
jgi:hypothetical protein